MCSVIRLRLQSYKPMPYHIFIRLSIEFEQANVQPCTTSRLVAWPMSLPSWALTAFLMPGALGLECCWPIGLRMGGANAGFTAHLPPSALPFPPSDFASGRSPYKPPNISDVELWRAWRSKLHLYERDLSSQKPILDATKAVELDWSSRSARGPVMVLNETCHYRNALALDAWRVFFRKRAWESFSSRVWHLRKFKWSVLVRYQLLRVLRFRSYFDCFRSLQTWGYEREL